MHCHLFCDLKWYIVYRATNIKGIIKNHSIYHLLPVISMEQATDEYDCCGPSGLTLTFDYIMSELSATESRK